MTVKEAMNSVKSPSGSSEVYELDKLLTDDFVQSVTDCKNVDELLFGISLKNQKEFDRLDVSVLDNAVSNHSVKYKTFAEFISAAVQYFRRRS